MNFNKLINKLKEEMLADLQRQLTETADAMADSMRARCPVDTGQLVSSISTRTERTESEINAYIDIGATSKEGAWYAEFVEYGTGIYNENGDGRQTPWRYQDREGNWHTTQGQEPQPFIRPAVAEHIGELDERIKQSMDLRRYRG